MVVRGSCLAAKLGVADIANVSPEGLGGAAGFAHAALEELLHEESALGGNNLLAAFTEDINIILAYCIENLNICAVHCAEGNGAVKHKFHIARTRRFLARGRNLLRDIRRNNKLFIRI